MSKKSKKSDDSNLIASNKKARHDYTIEQTMVAGMALEGWEVKSIRAGRVNLKESYVILKRGEAFLIGAHISPLQQASTHIEADPVRTRKLLLHERELSKLIRGKERDGYTVVALNLHWSRHLVKCKIGLAKGKKQHDKRESDKNRDIDRKMRNLKGKL
ncbi:MAG: SsrA-binding protein SmpB [Gammaproteobacteria bacterium]|nr:SsrA-binding protein SmpB [Gammaproteobacteria bacterium]MCH9744652.1 SsrA-binding protein SmpB [Gammaproteobacteria bacterium]